MPTIGPISVSQGSDDGDRGSNGAFSASSNPNIIGNIAGNTYDSWFTFRGVSATQGSTINSATLLITRSEVTTYTVSWKVRAVAADDPSPPTTAAGYNAFTWTTAQVTGTSADPASYSIDVKTIMQELVDRAGYAGDKVIFQFADNGSGTTQFVRPAAFESAAQEARLTVDYTAAAGGGTSKNLLLTGCG
jgi:hypothetical protein